jgi:RHS repeat-associated protein
LLAAYNVTPAPDYGQNAGYAQNCISSHGIDFAAEKAQSYWYHSDHLGSASYITGVDGKVCSNINYFPTGEVFVEQNRNSPNLPYKFNGKELDAETGYYYYGARYYNPKVSLWLNVDPLAEKTGAPYNYCYNNPVKLVDPDGMEPQGWIKQIINGIKCYTYDKNINTVAQAKAANYQNVESVSSALTISRESTLGFGAYEYKLRSTGTVDYMNHDFVTDAGTAILNVQNRPDSGLASGKIDFIGGLGDPFGIYEGGMMALSAGNPKLAKLAGLYSIAKGIPAPSHMQGIVANGFMGGSSNAVKGTLSGTKKSLIEAKNKIGLGPNESLPKLGTGKFGSPQRGDAVKGYRLDPPHPNAKPGSGEEFPHVNYWDYTNGKRGKGGVSGAIPIK